MKEKKIPSYRETMERKILNTIIDYYKAHGYCPSFREIASMVNLRSISSVKKYIDNMLQRGLLESEEKSGSGRAVRVKGSTFLSPPEKKALSQLLNILSESPCDTLCRHAHNDELTQKELEEYCSTCRYGLFIKEYEQFKDTISIQDQ